MGKRKQKDAPDDHPGQLGITEDLTDEIRDGADADAIEVFTKEAKQTLDVVVLQVKVAQKAPDVAERRAALTSAAGLAADFASSARRMLARMDAK